MRADNRRGICRKHGKAAAQFDVIPGLCALCGELVPYKSRGYHVSTACGTKAPWNKGKTTETDTRVELAIAKLRGVKRPENGEKIRASWQDPETRARYIAGITTGQRKRFESSEQRELSRERALKLIADGKIIPFGGRRHGNGAMATDSEIEMLKRLAPYGFVAQHIVRTGVRKVLPSNFKVDLAYPDKHIAIELDGGSHNRKRREADDRKTSFLQSRGWLVLRFKVPVDYDCAVSECVASLGMER